MSGRMASFSSSTMNGVIFHQLCLASTLRASRFTNASKAYLCVFYQKVGPLIQLEFYRVSITDTWYLVVQAVLVVL